MAKAKVLLEKAKKEGYAIGAFNTANLETLKSITQAAYNLKSPIILEASEGEVNYMGYQQLVKLARVYEEELLIPIIINLDHAPSFESCKKAVDAGFDYVHIDASKLPIEENIKITNQVVEYAHKKDVLVEGEMDHIQGSSSDHTRESGKELQNPDFFTKPELAEQYVKKTGIDVFASFIGNLHGVYAETIHLKVDILKQIKALMPNMYLSLHGGSGIYDEDVKAAIANGVVKVNVNSEMRIAFKMTLQEAINSSNEIAIYKIMDKPINEVKKVVETKIKLFGTTNKV